MTEMGEMQRKMRKGLWSPDEDEKLSRCIAMYMNGSWSDIARKAGLDRCGKSCRRRWMNHLRPDLKRGRFTPAEISRVIELHKALGNRWSEIAGHLVGRTDNDVKNLWNTQIKRRLKLQAASLDSSAGAGSDQYTDAKVDSQDDEVVSYEGGDVSPHKVDDEGVGMEKTVLAGLGEAPSSSNSSLQSFAPAEQYEDTLTCRLPASSSNGPLDIPLHECAQLPPAQTTSMYSSQLIKPNKAASVFTFPFSSALMFCTDLEPAQEDNQLPVDNIDACDASGMFTSFPELMDDPNSDAHINASSPGAVIQKCTSTRSHIPHALSSSNLRKLEASRPDTKPTTGYMDFPGKSACMQSIDHVSIQNDCNAERLDQQKCVMVEGVNQLWAHRSVYSDPVANCGSARQSCTIFETTMPDSTYCSLPMYEGASCSSTESSASTCSSTIDHSRAFSISQFGSLCKFKAAALTNAPEGSYSKENWQMYNNDVQGEVGHGSEYHKELLDGRSALLCNSGSSDDYVGNWWSSLEVPNFELPNIDDDANCWQPLDVHFV